MCDSKDEIIMSMDEFNQYYSNRYNACLKAELSDQQLSDAKDKLTDLKNQQKEATSLKAELMQEKDDLTEEEAKSKKDLERVITLHDKLMKLREENK